MAAEHQAVVGDRRYQQRRGDGGEQDAGLADLDRYTRSLESAYERALALRSLKAG